MPTKLYVVHGSHPCMTVARALELKGIPFKVVEFPAYSHVAAMRLLFGHRTVPGIRFEDGEKLQGSRAILRRLDEMVPEPALLPADAELRARVLRAEEWGDEVLQPLGRRIIWPAVKRHPQAMPSYLEGSTLPTIPWPVLRLMAPVVTTLESRLNDADEGAVRADLRALPGHLDRVDGWIAEGVMGGERPNAADLQIGSTLALLHTIGDVRPVMEGRPSTDLALALFPDWPGSMPAGVYPAEWLPAPGPAPAAAA
jgi:glutathione S-transferase